MADKVIEIKKVIGKLGDKQLTYATLKGQDKFDIRKSETDKVGIRFTGEELEQLMALNIPYAIKTDVTCVKNVEYAIHEIIGSVGNYQLCTMTWKGEEPTYNFTVIVNGRLNSRKLSVSEMLRFLQILNDAKKLSEDKSLADNLLAYDDTPVQKEEEEFQKHIDNITNITEKLKEKSTTDIINEAKKAQQIANNPETVCPPEDSMEFKFEFAEPTKEPDATDGLAKFKTQMKEMVESVKNKTMAEKQYGAVLKYIEGKFDDDYNKLMCQPNKNFKKMWTYITNKAREQATGSCAMIEESVVYGWADEYLSVDDYDEYVKEKEQERKSAEQKLAAIQKKTAGKKRVTKKAANK